jgi:hypothetical protein
MNLERFSALWREFQVSGLNQAQFTREKNINYATWQYWKKKNSDPQNLGCFWPVKIKEVETKNEHIKLQFKSFSLEIPQGFNEQDLKKVMTAIQDFI